MKTEAQDCGYTSFSSSNETTHVVETTTASRVGEPDGVVSTSNPFAISEQEATGLIFTDDEDIGNYEQFAWFSHDEVQRRHDLGLAVGNGLNGARSNQTLRRPSLAQIQSRETSRRLKLHFGELIRTGKTLVVERQRTISGKRTTKRRFKEIRSHIKLVERYNSAEEAAAALGDSQLENACLQQAISALEVRNNEHHQNAIKQAANFAKLSDRLEDSKALANQLIGVNV